MQQSFAARGVSAPVVRALERRGITTPFPVQQLVLPAPLAGVDVLAASPTGSGKTFAFGIPLRYTVNPVYIHLERPAEQQRADVNHTFMPVTADTKVGQLAKTVDHAQGLSLVFVRTKHGAERLARRLARDHNLRTAVMHGNMSQNARERSLARFEAGKVSTLVATDVAARGLDVDAITHVINFDPPRTTRTTYTASAAPAAPAGAEPASPSSSPNNTPTSADLPRASATVHRSRRHSATRRHGAVVDGAAEPS
jgi:superfamily II DNA/RNA helicase